MTDERDRAHIDRLWTRALAPDAAELQPPPRGVPFSAAGGHSLAAARIVAGIRAELGRRVSLADLLRADPTPDELAAMVAAAPAADARSTQAPGPVSSHTHDRAPLSRRMLPVWAFHRLHTKSAAYNVLRVVTVAGRVRATAAASGRGGGQPAA